MAILRACIECGNLSEQTRCRACFRRRDRERKQRRIHYKGDYKRRAAEVRANAEVCWICREGAREDDPWTADHIIPGDPESPLIAAHRSCNSRRGATSPRA